MVFAIVFEFQCEKKREVMRDLGGLQVGESAYLVDRSDPDARSVHSTIVETLVDETGLPEPDLFDDGERLYVIPVAASVAGRGAAFVDRWIDRRGLQS
jgi:hypothetical protein